jgi:hypothetical protein
MDSKEEEKEITSISNGFSFEELQKLTNEKKEEKKTKFFDRIKIGTDDAIKHITQDCYDKMKISASKGYDTTIIYTFSWVSDPDAIVDNNGNKTVFEGNIRLLDLVNKDRINFIEALNKYFNNDGEDKFHCYIKKNIFKGESVWTINVSWGSKSRNLHTKNNEENIHSVEESENQSPFKGTGEIKHYKNDHKPKHNKMKGEKGNKYVPKKKDNLI